VQDAVILRMKYLGRSELSTPGRALGLTVISVVKTL
jgi:hypothetical protein